MSSVNKKILGVASLLLVGCTPAIPEGDIKDFLANISFDNTYEKVNYGTSVIEVKHNQDENVVLGELTIINEFNKVNNELYFYSNTIVKGNFHKNEGGDYNFYNEERLIYIDQENVIHSYLKVDNEYKSESNDLESLTNKINSFFYNQLDENYHSGGMYYGDYIAMNCGKYYNRFSLNEEKNILTYAINTSSKTMDKGEVITMHKFSANEYGMIIDLSTKTLFVDYPENVVTTIKCDYETQINKKIYL